MHKRSVFIIGGGGMVGATAAQSLAIKEVVSDIVLIDLAEDLVRGQAMDINHAAAYTNSVEVRVGDYGEIKEDDIVVITCGAPQSPDRKHRMELLDTNARIIKDVVGKVMAQGKPVYIVMVTNPVDVLTYVALKTSGLPKHRVFGTGTALDTARLRVSLAHDLHVSQRNVHGYVLGEHGSSSFVARSGLTVSGVPLPLFPGFKPEMIEDIDETIRRSAYEIIAAKKSTYYGIGQVVATLVEALLRDTNSIFPVCSLVEGEYGLQDVVLGLPTLVSSKGVTILDSYPLNQEETTKLQYSAEVLHEAIHNLDS